MLCQSKSSNPDHHRIHILLRATSSGVVLLSRTLFSRAMDELTGHRLCPLWVASSASSSPTPPPDGVVLPDARFLFSPSLPCWLVLLSDTRGGLWYVCVRAYMCVCVLFISFASLLVPSGHAAGTGLSESCLDSGFGNAFLPFPRPRRPRY